MLDVQMLLNLRECLRQLGRTPFATSAMVVSLAVGLGATTAVFGVINALYLKPLPVSRSNELAFLRDDRSPVTLNLLLSEQMVASLQRGPWPFAGVAAYAREPIDIAPSGEPSRYVRGLVVTGSYFHLVGVNAIIGRLLHVGDERPGAEPVVVLSEGFWRSTYGADPQMVGRRIEVNRRQVMVAGVAPRTFFGVEIGYGFDVALTSAAYSTLLPSQRLREPNRLWLTALVRLRRGTSIVDAERELRFAQAQALNESLFADEAAGVMGATSWRLVPAEEAGTRARTTYLRPLDILAALAALVIGIASANAAVVRTLRAAGCAEDCAIRSALGASTRQLLLPIVLQSLVILGLASTLGLGLGMAGSRLLLFTLSASSDAFDLDLAPDWRVAVFVVALGAAAVAVSMVAPLRHAMSVSQRDRQSTSQQSVLERRRRSVSALVVAQVALTFALVLLGAVFVRSLADLSGQPLGFEPEGLRLVDVDADPERRQPWSALLMQQHLRALPGVVDVAYSRSSPFGSTTMVTYASMNGPARRESWPEETQVVENVVSDNYFRVMGMRVLSGRTFYVYETSEESAIVNAAFERKFLGSGSAVGKRLWVGPDQERLQVVGVVSDTRHRSLRADYPAVIYRPWLTGETMSRVHFSLRAAASDPTASVIAREVDRLFAGTSVNVRTLDWEIKQSTVRERVTALAAVVLGASGIVLTVIGLGGVMSRYVEARRREIAVRVCLGAAPGQLRLLVIGQVTASSILGVLIGYGLVRLTMPLFHAFLFDIRSVDLLPPVVAGVLIIVTAAAAAAGPLVRVTRIDPNAVLRAE